MTAMSMNEDYATGYHDGELSRPIDPAYASNTDYLYGYEDALYGAWVDSDDDFADDDEDDGQPSFQDEHDSQMMSIGWGTDEDYGYYGGDEDY